MSARLEALQKAVAEEKQLALAELGLSFSGPLLVTGDATPRDVINARLKTVPPMLHQEATMQMMRNLIVLRWLTGRRIGHTQKIP